MPKPSDPEELDGRPMTTFESRLVSLLALLLVQERKQHEQIALLNRAGFRSAEIAGLLETTTNNVSVQLSSQKRQKEVGRARKAKK